MIHKWLNLNAQFALDICVALLVFFVPLSPAFPNILIAPAGLLTLLVLSNKRTIKQPIFWYLLILFVLILLFQAYLVNDFLSELDSQRRLIAGLFIFILVSHVKRVRLLEKAFWLGLTIATFYSLILIVHSSIHTPDFSLGVGENVHNALIMERPYFAFTTVLANYLIFKNIRKHYDSKYYYVLAFLFGSFCFFISAKLGIALHIILLFHHVYRSIDSFKIKHILLGFISVTIIGFALVKNPYLKERLRISKNWETTFKKIKAYEPRFIIWDCSEDLLSNSILLGHRSHDNLNNALKDCYADKIDKEKKKNFYINSQFNTHNQFFDVLLTGGILTLIVFITAFLWPFVFHKNHDQLIIIFSLFIAFFLVENVLLRQTGCFLFGIFAALGYQHDREKN